MSAANRNVTYIQQWLGNKQKKTAMPVYCFGKKLGVCVKIVMKTIPI